MPVDCYLLPANISDDHGYHQGAYDIAYEAAMKFVSGNGNFVLFLTGLTTSALGAIDGMRSGGVVAPVCYNYDRGTNSYERIELHALVVKH